MAAGYTPKIDQLFDRAAKLGFTEDDFAALCVAAADQAGCKRNEQSAIAVIVNTRAGTRTEKALTKLREAGLL